MSVQCQSVLNTWGPWRGQKTSGVQEHKSRVGGSAAEEVKLNSCSREQTTLIRNQSPGR